MLEIITWFRVNKWVINTRWNEKLKGKTKPRRSLNIKMEEGTAEREREEKEEEETSKKREIVSTVNQHLIFSFLLPLLLLLLLLLRRRRHSLLMLLLLLALRAVLCHCQNNFHPDMHAQTSLFAQAKGIILIRSPSTNTRQKRELLVPAELIDLCVCISPSLSLSMSMCLEMFWL